MGSDALADQLSHGVDGLRLRIGSWKTMPISLPRMARISSPLGSSDVRSTTRRSRWKRIAPPAMAPPWLGTRPRGEGVYWDFKRKHHTARSYNAWIIQKEVR